MKLEENNYCTGCGMCAKVCPVNAIELVCDSQGFLRPEVSAEKCVDCGLCEKLCVTRVQKGCNEQRFLAVKNKDTLKRLRSSSGGFFFELARYVIEEKNGIVYGAAYDVDKDMQVVHTRVSSVENISRLMGSKYVQSRVENVYSQIEDDLKQDLLVCFSGTPCQVNALKVYLAHRKISDKNLITCDFVCHGVPSPKVWKDYVSLCNKKYGEKMDDYFFRYKDADCHWGSVNVCAKFDTKKIVNTHFITSYINMYFANLMTRKDCERCEFTSLDRVSDITMADCWGIEKTSPDFFSKEGVSLVIINSEAGAEIFESISDCFDIIDVDITSLEQPHLYQPCTLSAQSRAFWLRFEEKGYNSCAKKFTRYGLINRAYKQTRKLLGLCKRYVVGNRR